MLPPFIIEQIRQREERERQRRDESRPRLELPLEPMPARRKVDEASNEDDRDRGVIILDLMS
ncbi:MAG: hypothetical protein FJ096_17165 [Deltaproteobacteria bacterium]|nr:hypothetical protein [Deltaproteobacteria bacterium]